MLVSHMLLAGNAYIEAVALDGAVRELYALRPDRMKVVPGPDGWAEAYEYSVGGRSVRFDQMASQVPPILHLTFFHPLDDHYGLAPIEAAAVAVDTHNSAAKLEQGAARQRGAALRRAGLCRAGRFGAVDEQFDRLKRELTETYAGAANAGRPLLLEGGLDWKAMSLSPKDMDFLEAKHTAAREIALAFGVPPMLLGIPGDNTYSNYQEANRVFFRQTVLPLAAASARRWRNGCRRSSATASLVIDTDRIDALASDRAALWDRVSKRAVPDPQRKARGGGIHAGRWRGWAGVEGGEAAAPSPLPQGERVPEDAKHRRRVRGIKLRVTVSLTRRCLASLGIATLSHEGREEEKPAPSLYRCRQSAHRDCILSSTRRTFLPILFAVGGWRPCALFWNIAATACGETFCGNTADP